MTLPSTEELRAPLAENSRSNPAWNGLDVQLAHEVIALREAMDRDADTAAAEIGRLRERVAELEDPPETPLRSSLTVGARNRSRPVMIRRVRYRGVMELAWAGCDNNEIMAYSGHSTKAMVRKYAEEAQQIMRARQAREKRR